MAFSPETYGLLKGLSGKANGFASLNGNGKVPSSQLPSYVDDIEEYDSYASFPASGETGTIYLALDTGATYRWSGSEYVSFTSEEFFWCTYNSTTSDEIDAALAIDKIPAVLYNGHFYVYSVTDAGHWFVNVLSTSATSFTVSGLRCYEESSTTKWSNHTTTIDTSTLALLASPTLTGTPTAPTAAAGTNTTQIATTAFVTNAILGAIGGSY